MTRIQHQTTLLALGLALLAGCAQAPIAGLVPAATSPTAASQVLLRGQVDFLWQFFVTVHLALFALLFIIYDHAVEGSPRWRTLRRRRRRRVRLDQR